MTKFCTQCGAAVDEAARFCKKCGAGLIPTQPAQPGAAPSVRYQIPPNPQQPPYQAPYQAPSQAPSQPPYQSQAAHADLKPNVAGLLCYPLSLITGILFLALNPYNKDPFVRFHAYQSIFFFAAMFILNIFLGVITIVTPWFLDNLLWTGLRLLALGGTAWLMYQAYQGNKYKLPVIGDIAENQAAKQ